MTQKGTYDIGSNQHEKKGKYKVKGTQKGQSAKTTKPKKPTKAGWWLDAYSSSENADGFLRMQDDYNPTLLKGTPLHGSSLKGHRHTYLKTYSNGNTKITMPAARAIRRYQRVKDTKTLAIPVTFEQNGKITSGWVKATKGINGWHVNSTDNPNGQASIAVECVLNAKKVTVGMQQFKKEARKRRQKDYGATLEPIRGSWIKAAAYNKETGRAIIMGQRVDRHTGEIITGYYSYAITEAGYKALKNSETPTTFYNYLIKRDKRIQRSRAEKCEKCGRVFSVDIEHECLPEHYRAKKYDNFQKDVWKIAHGYDK
jgi:hypothetical protein